MTKAPEQDPNDQEMERAIKLRRERRDLWQREGERPLWKNLAMIGALGWLIVIPTLLGVFVGRYLDLRFGTGIFWSGALIFIGVSLGGYLAWQRISKNGNS